MTGTRIKKSIGLMCLVLALLLALLCMPVSETLAADMASTIETTPINGTVSGLNGTWVVLRRKTINGYNCTLLAHRGNGYAVQIPFNNAGGGTNYEGSAIQTFLTNNAPSDFSTLYSMAVVPSLGTHTDYTALSEPTAQMAKDNNIKKNVFFLLSHGDAYLLNGKKYNPLQDPLTSANFGTTSMMLRTAVTNSSANVCEVVISSGWIGYGMFIQSTGATVCISPAVWVRTSETTAKHTVTVHYVDGSTEIATATTQSISHGSGFTLNPVPTIAGYKYLHWKDGSAGSATTGFVQLSSVTQDKDIYLVYAPVSTGPERYLVSKDSNPGVVISSWHWLQEAVDAVKTYTASAAGPYTITATEDDFDVNGTDHDHAIYFWKEADITLTSDSGGPYVLYQATNRRHFDIQGKLTMKNIILDVTSAGGGIFVRNTLNMREGAILRNCKESQEIGAAVYLYKDTQYASAATFNMSGGEIRGNIASPGNGTVGGGGVYVPAGTSFNMSGGKISDNIANPSRDMGIGGGVYVNGGALTLSDTAEISGNTASAGGIGYGGGVYLANATFNMNGGTIAGNTAGNSDSGVGYGGGVYMDAGTMTMNGGTISGNTGNTGTWDGAGGGIYSRGGALTMRAGLIDGNFASTGNVLATQYASGGGVYVNAGGAAGSFTMSGGTVSNNCAGQNSFGTGGGVYIMGGGSTLKTKFDMSGGTICDNIGGRVDHGAAGGVRVGNYGVFNMTGGVVTRNQAATGAGSIYGNGGGVNVVGKSAFTMSVTAEVSGNTGCVDGPGNGGGVYVEDSAFTLKEKAVIKNNKGSEQGSGWGGGMYLNASAQFTATGTPQITGNTARSGDGGGIFSEDHEYNKDPVSTGKYKPIQTIDKGVVFSGNRAGARYTPPSGGPAGFPTALLNNDDINYHHTSGPIITASTLTVTKEVKGDYGDTTMEFNFKVTFYDAGGSLLPGETETFVLKHGESHAIEDVLLNRKFVIEEEEDANYSAGFVDSEIGGDPEPGRTTGLPRGMTQNRAFLFVNTHKTVPETCVSLGDRNAALLLPLLAILAGSAYFAAARMYRRRRREGA